MQRSLSSRIRMNFKDSKLTNLVFLSKPEHRYGPLDKFTEEDKILKGFIWKPKERPVSKESIIHSFNKITTKDNNKDKITAAGKTPLNKSPGAQAGKDTSALKPLNKIIDLKTGKDTSAVKSRVDSTLQLPVKKASDSKTKKDSTAAIKQNNKGQ
jgi:hypothetical protein